MRHRLVFLGFIVSANCIAQEFNTKAYCQEVAAFGGTYSYSTEASCRKMEAQSKRWIESRASRTPAMVLVHCEEVASFGGSGSYSTMASCIKMELDAKRSLGE